MIVFHKCLASLAIFLATAFASLRVSALLKASLEFQASAILRAGWQRWEVAFFRFAAEPLVRLSKSSSTSCSAPPLTACQAVTALWFFAIIRIDGVIDEGQKGTGFEDKEEQEEEELEEGGRQQ